MALTTPLLPSLLDGGAYSDAEMHAAVHAWGLGDIAWDPFAMARRGVCAQNCTFVLFLVGLVFTGCLSVPCAAAAARQEAVLRATEGDGWDACGGGGDAAMLEPALAAGAVARGGVLTAPETMSAGASALRPSDGAPTSSGDSAGAGDTGGTVSTGSGSVTRHLKWRWRGRGAAPMAMACSVPGCCAVLEAGGNGVLHKYALRHRMCLPHLRADVVDTADGPCRFCQARAAARPAVPLRKTCAKNGQDTAREKKRPSLRLTRAAAAAAARRSARGCSRWRSFRCVPHPRCRGATPAPPYPPHPLN